MIRHKTDDLKIPMLKAAVEEFRITAPLMAEYAYLQGVVTFSKYNGLIAAGFSEEKAIALCR